jgi:heterokaryon incompatibility protein (HET)
VAKLNNCLSSHPNCDAQHQTYGNPDAVDNLLGITMLVDVNQRRVVQGLGLVSYATLSYVWGSSASQNDRMFSSSSAQKRRIGQSLVYNLPKILPSTIEDAMKVTKLLGYDYIWVDSLCIQYDPSKGKLCVSVKRRHRSFSRANRQIFRLLIKSLYSLPSSLKLKGNLIIPPILTKH